MTDEQRQKKKEEILEALKEEIFVELDKRIKNTEKSLTEEIHHVEEVLEEKVEEEFGEHIEKSKAWRKKVREDLQSFQTKLSYYPLIYAAMVVAGFMLFWYGTSTLIPTIPYLSDGPIALLAGLTLLLITGAAHRKLVG